MASETSNNFKERRSGNDRRRFSFSLKKMPQNTIISDTFKRKYRSLKKTDDFYRAEIKLGKFDLVYQFKLRALSGNEACFLIKEDSAIFNRLKVGELLEMRCWTAGKTKTIEFAKAKIKNIMKQNQEPLDVHYLVYLSIPKGRRLSYDQRSSLDQRSKQDQLYVLN